MLAGVQDGRELRYRVADVALTTGVPDTHLRGEGSTHETVWSVS